MNAVSGRGESVNLSRCKGQRIGDLYSHLCSGQVPLSREDVSVSGRTRATRAFERRLEGLSRFEIVDTNNIRWANLVDIGETFS